MTIGVIRMTLEQRVRAVIESCFSESKEIIQDIAVKRIMEEFEFEQHCGRSVRVERTEKPPRYCPICGADMRGDRI